jgi:hypothetical protein
MILPAQAGRIGIPQRAGTTIGVPNRLAHRAEAGENPEMD